MQVNSKQKQISCSLYFFEVFSEMSLSSDESASTQRLSTRIWKSLKAIECNNGVLSGVLAFGLDTDRLRNYLLVSLKVAFTTWIIEHEAPNS